MKTSNPSPVRARANVKRRPPSQQTDPPAVVNFEPDIGYLANAADVEHHLQGFFSAQIDGFVIRLVPLRDSLPTAVGSAPLAGQLAAECERVARLYQHTADFLRTLVEGELGVVPPESTKGTELDG